VIKKGSESHDPSPIPFFDGKYVVQVSAGDVHAAALTIDGKVYTWGIYKSQDGNMGFKPSRGKDEAQDEPELMEELNDKKIIQVVSCKSRTIALTENGELYEWGFVRMLNKIPERHMKNRLLPQNLVLNDKVDCIFSTAGESVFARSSHDPKKNICLGK